jgi:dihydroorotate dehydrogenase
LLCLKEDSAIINRMGLTTAESVAVERLKGNKDVLIGGNIGKNKDTKRRRTSGLWKYVLMLYTITMLIMVNVSSQIRQIFEP